jgi:exodeoxyribonuclease V alpha subunit
MVLAQDGHIDSDFVIIDECSMVGVHLLSKLFDICESNTRFIFVCDEAQLASISCGNVVQDIIDSGAVPTATLTKIFRYGSSGLATVATDTRKGKVGPRQNSNYPDYQFISIDDKPIAQILDAYNSLLDKYTKDDIMILSSFNKGPVGTVAINKAIQSRYNPNPDTNAIRKVSGGEEIMFKVGDKVINTHNEYHCPCFRVDEDGSLVESMNDIMVMNGDMGYIRHIKETDTGIVMTVEFDTGMARIYGPYMNNLLLGYAISIHKSQGSEAKAVIVITSPMHKRMLSSNLLYVADSRAKEQLIEIGDVETIKEGLKRHEQKERETWLCELLKEGLNEKDNL